MRQRNHGILKTAIFNFEQAAERLRLDKAIRKTVLEPKERIEMNITPVLAGGKAVIIQCFLVRHQDALGPAKGGIRMSADVSLDDITGLAMEMTWKTSLIGVPFGGGKSGIRLDPAKVPAATKEIIIRSFTRGARRYIGPEIYIPAPDMGTNEKDMAHIRDCISHSEGISITKGCYVTGKPVILGGIVGRAQATGKGVVFASLAMCKKLSLDIADMRVAVQGFGNVGLVTASEFAKQGAKVTAVADISGAVVNPKGLDIESLTRHVQQTRKIQGFGGGEQMSREKIFEIECDILVPAAAASQITTANVNLIKARFISEGANSPTTPQADKILAEKRIQVIPDILCNAGGVFVSYLEYTQETQREQMTLPEVEGRLETRMKQRFEEVYNSAQEKGLSMREAAMDMAVSRVVEAVFARGFYP